MTAPLEIRLLGPFDVSVEGHPVVVSGSKRQALLAMLALPPGRVVGVDALIDALWGSDLPSSPRNAVQHHVARLRGALGHDAIAASGDGYSLPHAEVDAVRFEQLLEETRAALRDGEVRAAAALVSDALGLWRGDALLGLTDGPWFGAEAARLAALRDDAIEEQFDVRLALGEHRELVPAIRNALEREPFRERLWGQLMLALYRSGRQADALDVFTEARGVLSEQLGLEPGPDLRRLQDAILAHDPAIASAPRAGERRGTLPAPATSFVGREQDIARVIELLGLHRMVTLAGPPGVGKTRLALEVLRHIEHDVPDGVWYVDLARAGEPADVVRLTAGVVDVRGPDPLERIVARLRDAQAVVCLDSCEHVRDEAARVASAILQGAPGVRVLATSREVLRVGGEARCTISPLPVEDSEDPVESAAVALFEARAAAARPGFRLTERTAPIATKIVGLLDGLPLAIELAAAQINVLGLPELCSLLERRLGVFERPGAPDEVGAAVATLVEWSYDLLHANEKTVLEGIAVHRGGSSLGSLTTLGTSAGLDEPTVAHLLGALVDKSIVSVSFPADEARYSVLDTVRDYVLRQVDDDGGLGDLRRAHAEHFASLADASRAGLRGAEWRAWLERLEPENDNLWAALAFAREAGDADLAARLGASLGWYFATAERVSEGRRFLEAARDVGAPADSGVHAELLALLCYLAFEELDFEAAVAIGTDALALAEHEAPGQLPIAQMALGLALAESGEIDRGSRLIVQAHEGYVAAQDDWGAAASSLSQAIGAAAAGDAATVAAVTADIVRYSEACRYDAFRTPAVMLEAWLAGERGDRAAQTVAYRRALELARDAGLADHGAFALAELGVGERTNGDPRAAAEVLRQAVAAAEAAGSPWVATYARAELGRALAADGDTAAAEQLFRQALEWSETPRRRTARESLFVAIAGSPSTPALLGLADLADARGDRQAGDDLRGRAGLALT
jgi:predicted ATPase/DNA-binding SARP family transcriptional activator